MKPLHRSDVVEIAECLRLTYGLRFMVWGVDIPSLKRSLVASSIRPNNHMRLEPVCVEQLTRVPLNIHDNRSSSIEILAGENAMFDIGLKINGTVIIEHIETKESLKASKYVN